jgi:hypothetical protein
VQVGGHQRFEPLPVSHNFENRFPVTAFLSEFSTKSTDFGTRLALPVDDRLAQGTMPVVGLGVVPAKPIDEGVIMYEKPAIQRYGTLQELTLGQGPLAGGDATSVFHRS